MLDECASEYIENFNIREGFGGLNELVAHNIAEEDACWMPNTVLSHG